MVSTALFVRLVARPGKEAEASAYLKANRGVIAGETITVAWAGTTVSAQVVYIFDTAPDAARPSHPPDRIAAALFDRAREVFAPRRADPIESAPIA